MTEVQQRRVTGQPLGARYRLRELVGRGAAASVYRGIDEALGREVALKVFAREGGDSELLARQDAEIRILASLSHPALVALFDAGTDPALDRSFVVMEYVAGLDLRQHLRNGSLRSRDVASVGADVASGLDYVHGRGVIHRDVKPGNILLYDPRPGRGDGPWRAKLADFGIARVMEGNRLTGTGQTVGTAAYLSPEQALGGHLTGASDIYSLGLVLLECFTGHVEFPGNQIESGLARLNRNPAIPESLSTAWKALLAAMTARRPSDRPSAAEAAATLRQLALTPDTQAVPRTAAPVQRPAGRAPSPALPPLPRQPPRGLPSQPSKSRKRRRAAAGMCLAAVLIAGATTAALGGGRSGTEQPPSTVRTAVPVRNNPLDFHLDQLESAIRPSAALQPTLVRVRESVTADDPHTALTSLDQLEKAATDAAAGNSLTFEEYRAITAAIRLVRNDLQTLITASAEATVDALPAAPEPSPVDAPDPSPAAGEALPVPVTVINPPAAGGRVQQQKQTTTKPGSGNASNQGKSNAGKAHGAKGKNKD